MIFNTYRKIFFFFFFIISGSLIGQSVFESGRLPVKNFTSSEYNALPQIWDIVQDNRGVIYVANNEGVLEYDGIHWRMIRLVEGDNAPIRSLCVGKTGTIYVGGINELGYLMPDKTGLLKYNSLLNKIPENKKKFGYVWNIFETKEGILFHSNPNIFLLANDSIKMLSDPFDKFYTSFLVDEKFVVHDKNNGFAIFANGKLEYVKGSDKLIDIYSILPYKDNQWLVASRKKGLYLIPTNSLDISSNIKKFNSDVNKYLIENQVYNGLIVNDSLYSYGTMGGGLIIINEKGKLKYSINSASGIVDELIKDQYLDDNNNLWLGTENGISLVEINSPISVYDEKSGLLGSVQSIANANNKLYAVTNVGVFSLQNYNSRSILADRSLSDKYFINKGNKEEYWATIKFSTTQGEYLLALANDWIYQFDKRDNYIEIYKDTIIPWSIVQSVHYANRLFIGKEDGLESFIFSNKIWKPERDFEKIDFRIESIVEDKEGNLWLGTANDGILKVDLDYDGNKIINQSVKEYTKQDGLLDGPYFPVVANDTILFCTNDGIFQFDNVTETFHKQKSLGKNFEIGKRYIHRMNEDLKGNIWLATYMSEINRDEIGYARNIEDGYFYESIPFNKISAKGINYAIFHDRDNITWIGGPEGIYRFNGNVNKDYRKEYHALIRKVIIEKDSVIFNGTNYDENYYPVLEQPKALQSVLKYKYNSVTFEFSAQNTNTEFPLEFQFFLKGNDKEWSDWSDKNYKDYTNLSEGQYVFMVKTRDIYNHESTIASYEFTVLPPWYRTFWAYAGYAILLALFVYIVVTLYTKNLREIIKRKTAEIRKQKEEIEEINEHVMDSIKYAERIQSALLPSDAIREPLSEHFVLFKPRDIVSGDYYWMSHRGNKSLIVAADCTGHGVPGAFMSMLGMSFLNEIVNKNQIIESDQILNNLRDSVIGALKQTGKKGEAKDGMDLALYVWDRDNNSIEFSGAYNPMIYVRPMIKEELDMLGNENESFLEKGEIHDGKNILKQLKADKMPIGINVKKDVPFSKSILQGEKGYTLYTFSDGFVDQFGGEKGKKFMIKRFKQLLLDIYHEPMEKQKEILDKAFVDWIGTKYEQVDDIIIIGLRL